MSPWCWLNDGVQPMKTAHLSPTDRGFLLADGLFETIRIKDGLPCHLGAHLDRLGQGCAVLGLGLPSHATEAISAVIAANGVTTGSLRLTWTRGSGGPRGLLPSGAEQPTLLITTAPTPPMLTESRPWRLTVCTSTRRNEASPLSRIKSLNYGDGLLARREAAVAGVDDAILLNGQGRVAETSIATLFVCLGGVWLTPPVHDGALPGVRRGLALAAGIAEEASVSIADLASAEAAVLTSALMVQPVESIAGRWLPAVEKSQQWAKNSTFD